MYFTEKQVGEFQSIIDDAKRILLLSHQNPDGDAYASVLALFYYLKNYLNKEVDFYFDQIDNKFSFLNNIDLALNKNDIDFYNYDTVIFLDLNKTSRTGLEYFYVKELDKKKFNIINFDHHEGKGNFANLYFLDPNASATVVLLYRLFKDLNVKIDSNLATILLTGLLTDTSFLNNDASNSEAFQITFDLINLGAREKVIFYSLNRLSPNVLKALAEILDNLIYQDQYSLLIAQFSDELLEKYNINEKDLDILYYLLLTVKKYKVILVLKYYKKRQLLKFSWRTKSDNIDLNKFCALFNGGGHKKASAFAVTNCNLEKDPLK